MGAIVFTKCKAVCLFFTSLFVSIAGSYARVDKFTTTPKDKEVFVGGSVQFDWDYAVTGVREIRFGLVVDPEGLDREVAIYVKERNGTLRFNHMSESVKWIRKRVEVVPNRRASFKINSVQMDDSKTFFCLLVRDPLTPTIRDKVKLTVVDLLIDHKDSTQSIESWQGHKITVVCAVKLSAGERLNAKFSWMHIPSNRTVARRNHDDTRSKSYLTITTYKDEDFEELQCRAETKNTVKYHVINITRLSSPTQPRNLKTERHFDNGMLLIQLRWEPPQSNGGSTIEKYIVSHRPNELPWKQSTPSETKDSLFYNLRLQSGTTYHARVRAKNKAGISPPSNEVEINLEDVQMGRISSSRPLHTMNTFLMLLQFMLWLTKNTNII
ncbi:titin-like isoform X1 [Acropora millepora]|uniref:titin-like isoform X1 n=1 Tax=Acropora millepora TaxID=45264 RepID=UPI001CF22551|nr:titin-like isoform X1 [Acropora millepora]